MDLMFEAPVWEWRGPAPYVFVTVPDAEAQEIKDAEAFVTYGWGMIPVEVTIGATVWTTSLWPKDGRYVVPLKARVRAAEGIEVDDRIQVRLSIAV